MDFKTQEYLKETKMLDYSSANIREIVGVCGWASMPEVEQVKAIYGFVKDAIAFGYNSRDELKASRVLRDGFGQCNTKATLLMALLRACGVPCRIHGYTIDKRLQKGAMTRFVYRSAPDEIFHSVVEAFVGGHWYALEGVILDAKYLAAVQRKFHPEPDGSFIGYGVATKQFLRPPVEFYECDTFIQSEGIVRDFGTFDDPDALYKRHGQKMNFLKSLAYRLVGRRLMNRNVKALRDGK